MKFSLVAATAAALVGSALAFGQNPAAPAPTPVPGGSELKDLRSKASYSIGLNIGKNFKNNSIDLDPELLSKGLRDSLVGNKPILTDAEIEETLKAFQQQIQTQGMESAKKQSETAKKQAETAKKDGIAYLAANSKKPGVFTLPSGLQYTIVKDGAGQSPKPDDMVTVNYEGRLINGTVFDSSYKRGEPVSFPVKGVIKGWTEALQKMKVGSKWEIAIPSELAYGDSPRPGGPIPPGAALLFTVELLGIGNPK